jgi:hypothetical protein
MSIVKARGVYQYYAVPVRFMIHYPDGLNLLGERLQTVTSPFLFASHDVDELR